MGKGRTMATVICWFHQDLRLADHPALASAVDTGHAVVPAYVLDDEAAGDWSIGGASRWWLHHSLDSLSRDLERLGSRLVVRRGGAEGELARLVAETGAEAVYTHYRHEPWAQRQMERVRSALGGGAGIRQFHGTTLKPPGSVLSKTGGRMKVFTPFRRNLLAGDPPRPPLPRPKAIPAPARWPESLPLENLALLPGRPDWSGGLRAAWTVGEVAAHTALDRFLEAGIDHYDKGRDIPSIEGTSRLSPHLHHGEISPVDVYHRVMERGGLSEGAEVFLSEVIWREFAHELLDQAPDMPESPLREEFSRFPWREDYAGDLEAWQRGRTGFPLVDAGMRQLWETGWMHNRVRMITASFLIKHLLIPWQQGERWFWDTLVDADLASNSAGWQWVAGCGVDASPYFRIFNPITQGGKFQAHDYVRRWVPEVAGRDDNALFTPSGRDDPLDGSRGIYPPPIVSHTGGRERALAAFKTIKSP